MKAKTQWWGVLGGSFNPIHVAHLVLAHEALEQAALDKVLFIPTCVTPHKRRTPRCFAAARHRWAMVKGAIKGEPRFEACDVELRRGRISYTFETVRALRRKYPHVRWYWIIGSDSAQELRTWKNIGELAKQVTFLVGRRPGAKRTIQSPKGIALQIKGFTMPLLEISASDVRRRIRRGQSVRCFIPPKVEEYIRVHRLYGYRSRTG